MLDCASEVSKTHRFVPAAQILRRRYRESKTGATRAETFTNGSDRICT
jgi:hypothetical protein